MSILLLIGFTIILTGILNSARIFLIIVSLVKQYRSLNQSTDTQRDYPNILIIIPVLKESRVIANTIYLFNLLKYPEDKLKIVIASTEREYEDQDMEANDTISVIKNEIEKLTRIHANHRFFHIHYPWSEGVKPHQLNYAIQKMKKRFPKFFNTHTYIGVYDADSHVKQETLFILAEDARRMGYPEVYQQPTFYFGNFSSLPFTLNGILAGSFSFLQTAYALYYETYILAKHQFSPFSSHILPRMKYCIGHGLFIKWDLLNNIGLFPSPFEDTRLGHVLSYLKKEIRILPLLDNADATRSTIARINQISGWFIGEAFFVRDLKLAQLVSSHAIPKLLTTWFFFYKLYRNIFWIIRGPLLLFLFIFFLSSQWVIFAFAILITYLYLPIIVLILSRHRLSQLIASPITFNKKRVLFTFLAILATPLEIIIMSIGPLLGLKRFITFVFAKKSLPLSKTER